MCNAIYYIYFIYEKKTIAIKTLRQLQSSCSYPVSRIAALQCFTVCLDKGNPTILSIVSVS